MPLYPRDFDLRYFLGGNPDFVFPSFLRGGEAMEFENLNPEGYLSFRLPSVVLGFRTRLDGKWIDHRATLGSVIVEPDVPRVIMAWQTSLICNHRVDQLDATVVSEKRII